MDRELFVGLEGRSIGFFRYVVKDLEYCFYRLEVKKLE